MCQSYTLTYLCSSTTGEPHTKTVLARCWKPLHSPRTYPPTRTVPRDFCCGRACCVLTKLAHRSSIDKEYETRLQNLEIGSARHRKLVLERDLRKQKVNEQHHRCTELRENNVFEKLPEVKNSRQSQKNEGSERGVLQKVKASTWPQRRKSPDLHSDEVISRAGNESERSGVMRKLTKPLQAVRGAKAIEVKKLQRRTG